MKITSTDQLPKIIEDLYDSGLKSVHNMSIDFNGTETILCEITGKTSIGDAIAWILLKTEDLTILWTDTTLNHY